MIETEISLGNGFSELSETELMDYEGGVAPLILYGGAVAAGLVLGYAFGYIFS